MRWRVYCESGAGRLVLGRRRFACGVGVIFRGIKASVLSMENRGFFGCMPMYMRGLRCPFWGGAQPLFMVDFCRDGGRRRGSATVFSCFKFFCFFLLFPVLSFFRSCSFCGFVFSSGSFQFVIKRSGG
ncbi:hypothetical protein I3842_03G242700 [Carya illinoinensis]|uniref:Transmembrane protein n=1 Tax=Carya illinoinensis TaxID=32201 RepID=A0A922FKN7_CARIL|nr:hypothetical protein I3842_03G242700 [Carya illinoinensis]